MIRRAIIAVVSATAATFGRGQTAAPAAGLQESPHTAPRHAQLSLSARGAKVDVGILRPGEEVRCSLDLNNDLGRSVLVVSTRSSCGCVATQIPQGLIYAGNSGRLAVSLRAPERAPANILQRVWVTLDGQAAPFTIELEAVVSERVAHEIVAVQRLRSGELGIVIQTTAKDGAAPVLRPKDSSVRLVAADRRGEFSLAVAPGVDGRFPRELALLTDRHDQPFVTIDLSQALASLTAESSTDFREIELARRPLRVAEPLVRFITAADGSALGSISVRGWDALDGSEKAFLDSDECRAELVSSEPTADGASFQVRLFEPRTLSLVRDRVRIVGAGFEASVKVIADFSPPPQH